MNLYLLTQKVNNGYDTYDSMVVAAENEYDAVRIAPSKFRIWSDEHESWMFVRSNGSIEPFDYYTWAKPSEIKVKLLGTGEPGTTKGVILASFNAG